MTDEKQHARRGNTKLSDLVLTQTSKALRKRGFGDGRILTDWDKIVGERIAANTMPVKVSYQGVEGKSAVLEIKVSGSAAPLVQMMESQILDKIATYFGYKLISRLKIVQAPIVKKNSNAAYKTELYLDNESKKILENKLSEIENPEIMNALNKLGTAVLYKNKTGSQ